jgi:choline dehydrogenase
MKITIRNKLMAGAGRPGTDDVLSIVPGLYHPAGKGALHLVSDDPRVQPSIDFRFLEEESDRRRLREAVRMCSALMSTPELKALADRPITPSLEVMESDAALDEWMLGRVRNSQHPCGTCRMGPASDPTSVVDQFGRVHRLDGVRVADASVFPSIVRSHINATVIVVSERIAQFVKASHN